ncbi:MAG: RecX family transcriptional regulator [Clostridia bacterium]
MIDQNKLNLILNQIKVEKRKEESISCDFFVPQKSFGTIQQKAWNQNLKKEKKVSKKTLNSEEEIAMQSSLNMLSACAKTEYMLTTALVKKGISKEVIFQTIEKLKKWNYINDVQFAIDYANSVKSVKGKKVIMQNLSQKGICDNVISSVISQIGSQTEAIKDLIEKTVKEKEINYELKAKIFRSLASKGFEFDEISSAISAVFRG